MMRVKYLILYLMLVFLLLQAGCPGLELPGKKSVKSTKLEYARSNVNSDDTHSHKQVTYEGPTAVESAIELSKKYAKLSKEVSSLSVENKQLRSENERLQTQITEIQENLEQAEKELSEANDFLVETRVELNNWKKDILGFRNEMREAEVAQLEALYKVLKILGGEPEDTATADENGSDKPVNGDIGKNKPAEVVAKEKVEQRND